MNYTTLTKMFSKFFSAKNESELAALEMQWQMEFAKASRKFRNSKPSKGRPALNKLPLGMFSNLASSDSLNKIARDIASTRDGRRVHHQVAEEIAKHKAQKNTDCKKKVCA